VRAGEFREDLWYRLAGQVIDVPPLRSRPEDIEAYLRLPRAGAVVDVFTALDASARRLVLSHAWSGNFRELAAFAARLPAAAAPDTIGERDCTQALDSLSVAAPRSAAMVANGGTTDAIDLPALASAALSGFREDYERELSTWDDVKDCLERYLKPLMFARMTGAERLERREQAAVSALAEAIDADRGTVLKQLARYFDRFR
jgi:transcriptional regulator of acetoin/glycerol metabolism